MDEHTVVPTTENTEETETLKTSESQTDEGGVEPSIEPEDVGKKESDYYETELKRLQAVEAEKEKLEESVLEKERIIEHKNRALQAEKNRRRPSTEEPTDRESLKREVLTEIRVDAELEKMTATPAERKIIFHHYQSSIVKTGDVREDLKRALAVSNANRMQELLNRQASEDAADDSAASSMLGTGYGAERGPSHLKSQARKEAENIIKSFKSFKPEMLKNLDKYLPR